MNELVNTVTTLSNMYRDLTDKERKLKTAISIILLKPGIKDLFMYTSYGYYKLSLYNCKVNNIDDCKIELLLCNNIFCGIDIISNNGSGYKLDVKLTEELATIILQKIAIKLVKRVNTMQDKVDEYSKFSSIFRKFISF